MLWIGGKRVELFYVGGKAASAVYIGAKKVWSAIRSCFGSGFWVNEKPWINNEPWKNK